MRPDLSERLRRHIEERFSPPARDGLVDFSAADRRRDDRSGRGRYRSLSIEDRGLDLVMREQVINMSSQDAREYREIQSSVRKAKERGVYEPPHLRWIIEMKRSLLERYVSDNELSYPFLRTRVMTSVYEAKFPSLG